MHRFETTPSMVTGNATIDGQLQNLFAMTNEVLYSAELARSTEQFRRAVVYMVSYLEYHFAAEELAMLQGGYESRRFHTAFHDHVRREAKTIATSLSRKGTVEEARSAIFFMLEDWVEYHVREADRLLASYLREHAAANGNAELPDIRPLKATGSVSFDFDENVLSHMAGLA